MGLILRTSSLANAGNSLSIKGSALTYTEGDGNFMYLLTNMSGSSISITGSTGIRGNLMVSGSFTLMGLSNSNGPNVLMYNSASGQFFYQGTGSLTVGTASFVTSSNVWGPFGSNSILSASYASGSTSASYALSSSYAQTSSYAFNAQTASYVTSSNVFGPYGANSILSASYASGSTSASFALTASNTPNAVTTASVSINTITFTKGNGTTFDITVDTGSATAALGGYTTTASFNAYTSSINAFTSSATSSITALQTSASNALITASVSLNTITFKKGNGTTFNIIVDTGSVDLSGYTTTSSFNAYTSSINSFSSSIKNFTSSINSFTSSINSFSSSILNFTSSITSSVTALQTSASNALITASVSSNIVTFTKGNGTTFNITIDTGSAAANLGGYTTTASFNAHTSSINSFSSSILNFTSSITSSVTALQTSSSNALTTASIASNTITFTKGNGTTFDITVNTGSVNLGGLTTTSSFNAYTSSINAFTSSATSSITALQTSASNALITASVSSNTITFTKGGGSTFNITIDTGSAAANLGGYATTASFNAFSSSILSFTSSINSFSSSILNFTSSITSSVTTLQTSASNALITASVTNNVITFTKGGGSTFNITINTGSIDLGGYATTSSLNAYTSSINSFSSSILNFTSSITSSVTALQTSASNALITASVSSNVITFTKGGGSTFNITIDTGSATANLGGYTPTSSFNAYTSSINTFTSSILNFTSSITSSVTALQTSASNALTTASVSNNTITFTKGNGTTFNVTVNTGSIDLGGLTTTSSFNAYTSSINSYTSSTDTAISNLNSFTGSASTFITNLQYSASVALTTASVSLNTVTFTKGDGTTFNITVNTGSTNLGGLTTTSSFNAFTSSILSFTSSINAFTSSINSFSSSILNFTSSITSSVTALQTSASNALITASLQGSSTIRFTKGNGTTFDVTVTQGLTGTRTGTSASLILSSSGAITSSLTDGLVWIISNDTAANNGDTYIWNSGSQQWFPIAPLDQTAGDARYLQLAGGTMTGNITMGSGVSLIGTASWASNAVTSSYPLAVSGSTIYPTYQPTSNFNGINSILVGYYAGSGSTNGKESIFLGYRAGNLATNASGSNFIGYDAGWSGSNAANSNFIGYAAGYQSSNSPFSNFIGYYAGRGTTAASYSVFLGYQAGYSPTANIPGSNNIIIGTNITLDNNRRNSINIGGIIFGTGSYATTTGNPSSGSAGGRIGINTPIPTYNLQVSGTVAFTNLSTSPTAITNVVMVDTNGQLFVTSSSAIGGGATVKAGSASIASFTGNPSSSAITFGSAFTDNLYAVTVTGEDARIWTIQSKSNTGFTINSNSTVALTGPVYWIATPFN